MRTIFAKVSVVAALAAPLVTMGVAAAPASASGGTICSGNSGTIKLSPGLENTAQVQNIVIKGTLSGCSGEAATGAKYVAHLKTVNAASCATLLGAGAPAAGTIIVKWSPKGQGTSHGTISMPLATAPDVTMSGKLESGPFERLGIFGTSISQIFGACGGAKLKTGSFTGTPFRVTGHPKASIGSPAKEGVYKQSAVVPTTFSCVDSTFGPGIESCVDSNGSSSGSGTLETAIVGPHTYSVTATSLDGLTGKATIQYSVEP